MAVASLIYNGFWALLPILLACPEITVRRVPILSCHMAKQCRDKNGISVPDRLLHSTETAHCTPLRTPPQMCIIAQT